MKLTLVTNCIIDFESRTGCVLDVQSLVDFHERSIVTLQVPGIMASERVRAGGYLPNFAAFTLRVQQICCRPIEVLKPIGHWDVTYWDEGLWADDSMIDLEKQISRVLFPDHHYEWSKCALDNGLDPKEQSEESVEWKKWRNRLCDASALWCHIHNSGDVFVTNDNNFLRNKRTTLEALGAKSIMNPRDACIEISRIHK